MTLRYSKWDDECVECPALSVLHHARCTECSVQLLAEVTYQELDIQGEAVERGMQQPDYVSRQGHSLAAGPSQLLHLPQCEIRHLQRAPSFGAA